MCSSLRSTTSRRSEVRRTASFDRDWRQLNDRERKLFREQIRAFHDAAEQQAAEPGVVWPKRLRVKTVTGAPQSVGDDVVVRRARRPGDVRVDRDQWRAGHPLAAHRWPRRLQASMTRGDLDPARITCAVSLGGDLPFRRCAWRSTGPTSFDWPSFANLGQHLGRWAATFHDWASCPALPPFTLLLGIRRGGNDHHRFGCGS